MKDYFIRSIGEMEKKLTDTIEQADTTEKDARYKHNTHHFVMSWGQYRTLMIYFCYQELVYVYFTKQQYIGTLVKLTEHMIIIYNTLKNAIHTTIANSLKCDICSN